MARLVRTILIPDYHRQLFQSQSDESDDHEQPSCSKKSKLVPSTYSKKKCTATYKKSKLVEGTVAKHAEKHPWLVVDGTHDSDKKGAFCKFCL